MPARPASIFPDYSGRTPYLPPAHPQPNSNLESFSLLLTHRSLEFPKDDLICIDDMFLNGSDVPGQMSTPPASEARLSFHDPHLRKVACFTTDERMIDFTVCVPAAIYSVLPYTAEHLNQLQQPKRQSSVITTLNALNMAGTKRKTRDDLHLSWEQVIEVLSLSSSI